MRILCVFGQHNYGIPARGEGIEYVNFLPALRRLGHEVIFFESMDRDTYADFCELNHALLSVVEQERPDVLFAVVFTFEIWLETWKLIRESGIAATVTWATDDDWKYTQSSRFYAPYVHACATTYPRIYERYREDGINHVLLTQWAANASRLRAPRPAVECRYQVSFVGTAHEKRKQWIEDLHVRGIEVDCFGYGWPNGPIPAEEISEIVRDSVISLNFSDAGMVWNGLLPTRENQLKARTFEVPGAGGFLLTEWAEGMDEYYNPGAEIVVFRDLDELAMLIHYYLSHVEERDEIANAGFARTEREHIYDQRLDEVIDFAVKMKKRYEAAAHFQAEERIQWAAFAAAEKRHELNRLQKWVRDALVRVTSLIWGPVRGPRAARAILFQISYRLFGGHTYSSAGWPGRMFYRES